MLFNLEYDSGDAIVGYIVPDGFSEQPGIRVTDDGQDILEMDCDQVHQAVVGSGRHATGLIGFRLTEAMIPDLRGRSRLIVLDRKTGMLVYRRPQQDQIVHKKVLRLENRLIPFQKIDKALDLFFQFSISGVERFGHETTLQAFHLNSIDSIFISGRLLVKNYDQFLESGFDFITILNEPYQDMAERIFMFNRYANVPSRALGERDRMIISPAVDHFTDIDLTSTKALKRALRTAGDPVRRVLASPFTRQLVSTYPEQAVSRHSIAPAMDTLSRFSIIGLRDDPETFTQPLSELFDIPVEAIPEPSNHAAVVALADRLRELPDAEMLLELDLILHHFAREKIVLHNNGDEAGYASAPMTLRG